MSGLLQSGPGLGPETRPPALLEPAVSETPLHVSFLESSMPNLEVPG